MSVPKQAVAELREKCGLSAKECQSSLAEHGGHVDAALAALIDAGRVSTNNLTLETASDELFERAARRQKLETYRKFVKPGFGLTGLIAGLPESDDPAG